jgi:hypothetical protein
VTVRVEAQFRAKDSDLRANVNNSICGAVTAVTEGFTPPHGGYDTLLSDQKAKTVPRRRGEAPRHTNNLSWWLRWDTQ